MEDHLEPLTVNTGELVQYMLRRCRRSEHDLAELVGEAQRE